MPLQRIVVVGTTGSGKTTLGGRIGEKLGIPHIELDALHWGPEWTPRPVDVFRDSVIEAVSHETWIVDGNYSQVRDILWSRADTIVWLDYPLRLILWRLWWRTMRRGVKGEKLWNDNQERLWVHFFSRDSLFLWAFKTYWRRKREYPQLLSKPEYTHLTLFHHYSTSETEKWLSTITSIL